MGKMKPKKKSEVEKAFNKIIFNPHKLKYTKMNEMHHIKKKILTTTW